MQSQNTAQCRKRGERDVPILVLIFRRTVRPQREMGSELISDSELHRT